MPYRMGGKAHGTSQGGLGEIEQKMVGEFTFHKSTSLVTFGAIEQSNSRKCPRILVLGTYVREFETTRATGTPVQLMLWVSKLDF